MQGPLETARPGSGPGRAGRLSGQVEGRHLHHPRGTCVLSSWPEGAAAVSCVLPWVGVGAKVGEEVRGLRGSPILPPAVIALAFGSLHIKREPGRRMG